MVVVIAIIIVFICWYFKYYLCIVIVFIGYTASIYVFGPFIQGITITINNNKNNDKNNNNNCFFTRKYGRENSCLDFASVGVVVCGKLTTTITTI